MSSIFHAIQIISGQRARVASSVQAGEQDRQVVLCARAFRLREHQGFGKILCCAWSKSFAVVPRPLRFVSR
jgi:hypothetical protein